MPAEPAKIMGIRFGSDFSQPPTPEPNSLCRKSEKTARSRARPSRLRALQSRDRKGAVEPPMAANDGKAVAQVLDSKRDHSGAGFDTGC
jgi:hypothetical protein